MKSLIIGIARPGTPYDEVLNPRNDYVSLCGNKPEVSFSINCGQHDFLKQINGLRYDDADPSASAGAISFVQDLVTKIFSDLKYAVVDTSDPEPLHIRLVTTPFELAQLPFEFVRASVKLADGTEPPLLVHPEKMVTLTREVRQEEEIRYEWPHSPRILFAWAGPGGEEMAVPHEQHLAALTEIVRIRAKPKDSPVPEPQLEDLLTELPNASVEAIQKKIEEAKGRPYTHLHILAHGVEKPTFGVTGFELSLCEDGEADFPQKVDGKALAEAFLSGGVAPTVVSLSVCDSGNTGNTIFPSGSLVYQLHTAGIPCVFASQFPLTQRGSVTLVETLYRQLLDACDPRTALYETRMALKETHPTHDWASLVAYARFPEDIEKQLQTANLKNLFGSMKVTNAWVDHAFKYWDKMEVVNKETLLQNLETRLAASIQRLSKHLDKDDHRRSTMTTALLQAEHLGLLGSAYKRKAEYLFRLRELYPDRANELKTGSREALLQAKDFYRCGIEANPASHWTTMQYLSLKAVTEGAFAENDIELWHLTKFMAGRDEQTAGEEKDRLWTWGTMAELYLLKPLAVPEAAREAEWISAAAVARTYVQRLAATGAGFNDVKESTARQLERYTGWWPELFPDTFPAPVKAVATEIRHVLPALDALL